MRFLKHPEGKEEFPTIPWEQRNFTSLYKDAPASTIPNTAVAEARNALLFGERFRGRPGTRVFDLALPIKLLDINEGASDLRSDYELTKSGTTVTIDNSPGQNFVAGDAGSYIVWPDGVHDLIVSFTSATEVEVFDDTANSAADPDFAAIRGKVNAWTKFEKSEYVFIHIDNRVFYSDYQFSAWTEVINKSGSVLGTPSGYYPADSKSSFDIYDEYIYLFTSNGHFKIDTNTTPPEMVCINTVIPPNTINLDTENYTISETETDVLKFGRRYLFSMSRQVGSGIDDRSSNRILKETGTNAYGADRDYIDWEAMYKSVPFEPIFKGTGPDSSIVIGSPGVPAGLETTVPTTILSDWKLVTDGAFGLTYEKKVDGSTETRQVVCDFENIKTWDDIATVIEDAITATFKEFGTTICTYDGDSGKFSIYPSESDYKISASSAGTAGTVDLNVAAYLDWSFFKNVIYCGLLGSPTNNALQVPSGQVGWTHYSLYSTLTLGADNEGQNEERYVWQKDIPVVKVFRINTDSDNSLAVASSDSYDIEAYDTLSSIVTESGDGVISGQRYVDANITANPAVDKGGGLVGIPMSASDTEFFRAGYTCSISDTTNYDGDYTIVSQTATEIVITATYVAEVFAGTEVVWTDYNYSYTGSISASQSDIAACIGASKILKATVAAGEVTRTSGDVFTSADIGKILFFEDGDYATITRYEDADHVDIAESYIKSEMAVAFEPTGRNYVDEYTDEELSARVKSFTLYQRLWDKLPNGPIGITVPGFLSVADENDVKFYFSQMPDTLEYLTGHHNPEFQYNVVKDSIRGFSEFLDQMIIYCGNSTWRVQTNDFDLVEETRIGTNVVIMTGLSTVDNFIGLQSRSSVIRVGNQVDAVITSEPGIRLFDGRNYSEDLTVDSDGRGFIKTELQEMRPFFSMGYEPNIFGLMFWGDKTSSQSALVENIKLTECWRRALKPQHGFNFSELYGDNFVFPEPFISTLLLKDSYGNHFTVILNASTGKPVMFMTRKSSNSGTVDLAFRDEFVDDAESGEPIPWSIKYKEHTATEERFRIRHMETHNQFRPESEANRNGTGYDSGGYQDGLEIDVKAYVDGELTETSKASNISMEGLVAFTKTIVGRRVQLEVEGSHSDIQGISHKTLYDMFLTGDDPDDVNNTEISAQRTLGRPLFWLTRGKYYGKNLATGSDPDSGTVPDLIEGPDGKSSGFTPVSTAPMIWSDLNPTSRNFTIMFGLQDFEDGVVFLTYGDIQLSLTTSPSNYRLTYVDSTGTATIDFSDNINTAWGLFSVVRTNYQVRLFLNGVYIGNDTIGLATIPSGTLTISGGNSTIDMFDIRVYDDDITDANIHAYYNRDIIDQEGFSLLPIGADAPPPE